MRDKFTDWLNKKYLEWQLEIGRPQNATEFARYLGIERSLISRYLAGDSIPANDNAVKLANKFGEEVYELLEWERPAIDSDLEFFMEERRRLSKQEWQELMELVKNRTQGPLSTQKDTGS